MKVEFLPLRCCLRGVMERKVALGDCGHRRTVGLVRRAVGGVDSAGVNGVVGDGCVITGAVVVGGSVITGAVVVGGSVVV